MTYKSEVKNDKGYELCKDDPVFLEWKEALEQRRTGTAHSYQYGIIYFSKFCKRSPAQLLQEAKDDYVNRVPPWELRHIKHIEKFAAYLLNDGQTQSTSTKLNFIKAVKHFYAYYKIPVIGVKHGLNAGITERYQNIPLLKLEDIRKAVLACGTNKMVKAMILTLLSSGQGQYELRSIKGRLLKNVINGVAIVEMVRGKTKRRYTFFIGNEALEAIKDYKPNLKDDEYLFTKVRSSSPLSSQEFDNFVKRIAESVGLDQSYFSPHRFRHYWKSSLTGTMDSTFLEFLMGHKLPGAESNYFLGNQDKMLEQYVKNQDKLTIFTDQEVLQKQYDDLKEKHNNLKSMFNEDMLNAMIEARVKELMKKG
jgi:integrase